MSIGPAVFDRNVLVLKKANLAQAFSERHQHFDTIRERPGAKDPDYWHCGLLRRRPQRPPSSHPGKPRNHLPPSHSITSSARARRVGGIVRPSALAVLRLIVSSYRVACSTGRSEGLSPLRILST